MSPSIRETEIKLRFDSAQSARDRLRGLCANDLGAREFEDNIVYDDPSSSFERSHRLLRLRRIGGRSVLTYKEPARGDGAGTPHKVREEIETEVADFEAMRRVLERLGYRPVYRYQKYRTRCELAGVEVSIDETPLGCFVELEGPPDAIDRLAARLGCGPERYITATYRDLHREAAGPHAEPGDLLLERTDGTRGAR